MPRYACRSPLGLSQLMVPARDRYSAPPHCGTAGTTPRASARRWRACCRGSSTHRAVDVCSCRSETRASPRSKLGATNVCTRSNETGAEETGRRRASDRELAFKPLSSALVASSLDAGHQIVPSSRRPDDSANPLGRHVADARRRRRERPGAVGQRVGGHCRAIGPAAKCHATLWSSDENPAAIAAHISAWCYSLKM